MLHDCKFTQLWQVSLLTGYRPRDSPWMGTNLACFCLFIYISFTMLCTCTSCLHLKNYIGTQSQWVDNGYGKTDFCHARGPCKRVHVGLRDHCHGLGYLR